MNCAQGLNNIIITGEHELNNFRRKIYAFEKELRVQFKFLNVKGFCVILKNSK